MADTTDSRSPIDALADDFLQRFRLGERPQISDYVQRFPELADEIRDLFPVLLELESARPSETNDAILDSGQACAAPLPPLRKIGDFRVIREVGRGGMGIVYEAEQISLGRRVALKILPQQMLLKEQHRQRFEREAKAAARLHHTNIVPVFGVGEADGYHFYVMQFIRGLGLDEVISELRRMNAGNCDSRGDPSPSSLKVVRRTDVSAANVARSLVTGAFERTVLHADDSGVSREPLGQTDSAKNLASLASPTREEPVSDVLTVSSSSIVPGTGSSNSSGLGRRRRRHTYWLSVADVGRQVAEALEYAHRQEVLHRDVKPSNLLLDLRGTVWITDFGLAKASDQHDLTQTGDILGTFRYIPPEAFEGRVDVRGDVYSLGVTLYELLALRPAFDAQNRGRLIKQVTTSEPPRLDSLNARIPRDLVTIVHKAIDREPSHRYRTAKDLADDLERFILDEPIRARRSTAWERIQKWARRNQPIVWSLVSVAALLMIGMMIVTTVTLRERANTARQRDVAQAQRNLARQAVDKMFTQVAEQWLAQKTSLEPLQEKFLQDALDFYTKLAQEQTDDPDLRLETGRAYGRIAAIQFKVGKYRESEDAFQQATGILEDLVREHPRDVHYREALATNYHEHAFMLRYSDRTADAQQVYQQAYEQRQIMAEAFPDVARYRRDMALSLGGVANAVAELGQWREPTAMAQSIATYQKILNIAESLPKKVWREGRYRLDLGLLNVELAEMLRAVNGDAAKIWTHFDRGQALYQELVDEFPTNPAFRNELAYSHFLAGQWRRYGTMEAAEVSYERAIEIESQLVRESPTVPDYQFVLGISQKELADVYQATGRSEEAVAAYRQAIELLAALVKQNPGLRDQIYSSVLADACRRLLRTESTSNNDVETLVVETTNNLRDTVGDKHPAVRSLVHCLRQYHARAGDLAAKDEAAGSK